MIRALAKDHLNSQMQHQLFQDIYQPVYCRNFKNICLQIKVQSDIIQEDMLPKRLNDCL